MDILIIIMILFYNLNQFLLLNKCELVVRRVLSFNQSKQKSKFTLLDIYSLVYK